MTRSFQLASTGSAHASPTPFTAVLSVGKAPETPRGFLLSPLNVSVLPQAPLWAYLLCAVGLFIYQSLDAIDGKQARRTNSSSPLGELFDHGCDSLSTGASANPSTPSPPPLHPQPLQPTLCLVCAVFVVLGTSIAVQMGTNPDWMFFCCFAGMFMFYCAHWQTYVSGTLRFGM